MDSPVRTVCVVHSASAKLLWPFAQSTQQLLLLFVFYFSYSLLPVLLVAFCFQWEILETISGRDLRSMLQIAFESNKDDDDDDDDDEHRKDNLFSKYNIEDDSGRQAWVSGTRPLDSASAPSTWMATLLYSLQFRVVNRDDIPSPRSLQSPSQCLQVYVLDSNLQPAPLASANSSKPEIENDRSASVVTQSQNAVESPALRTLPDLSTSPLSSLSSASSSRRRQIQRVHSDVTSTRPPCPPVPPKPNYLQSPPPPAARYPLRRKTLAAGPSSPEVNMTSVMLRDQPAPPPLPARRERLKQATHGSRAHLEPLLTSQSFTDLSVSAGKRQHVPETPQDEGDNYDDYDDDDMNFKMDVSGPSMLDDVLQAANSLSPSNGFRSDEIDDDEAISQQHQQQQQQQQQQQLNFGDDNSNIENDKPVTHSTVGSKTNEAISDSNNFGVSPCKQRFTAFFKRNVRLLVRENAFAKLFRLFKRRPTLLFR